MRRMGASAEVVLSIYAADVFLRLAVKGFSEAGLEGSWEEDANGRYAMVYGVTEEPEVGMIFVTEGSTEADDGIVARFRSHMETGVLVVMDVIELEFAIYIVDEGGPRAAAAVVSE